MAHFGPVVDGDFVKWKYVDIILGVLLLTMNSSVKGFFYVGEQFTQKTSTKKHEEKQCEDDIRQEVQVNYVSFRYASEKTIV